MLLENSLNWHISGAVLGATTIAILAVKYGKPGWTKTDKICLTLAGIAIALMFINPTHAIITSLFGLVVGAVPTFKSVWKNPKNEDKLAWNFYWISSVFAIMAIPQLSIEDSSQPFTFFIIDSIVMYAIYFRNKKHLQIIK
ncbi:hypothetical protein ACFL1Y_00780 [Patescibacteria group bacterium]